MQVVVICLYYSEEKNKMRSTSKNGLKNPFAFGPTPFLLQLLITDNDDDAEKDDDEIPLSIVVYILDILFKACFVTHETCPM